MRCPQAGDLESRRTLLRGQGSRRGSRDRSGPLKVRQKALQQAHVPDFVYFFRLFWETSNFQNYDPEGSPGLLVKTEYATTLCLF